MGVSVGMWLILVKFSIMICYDFDKNLSTVGR